VLKRCAQPDGAALGTRKPGDTSPELAEPEGFISIFIEEGPPIAGALAIVLKRNLAGNVRAGYIQDILAAFPGTQPPNAAPDDEPDMKIRPWTMKFGKPNYDGGRTEDEAQTLVEPLTHRELEVLQLIAAGDSNRTIAEKLVITVSAVKKHTANIVKVE
jgi:LuxR family maltose regulon positive regulatory protein